MNFLVKIIDGKLSFGSEHNEARWQQFLQDNEGKTVKITKETPQRTLSQNAFYFHFLEVIARETGNEVESLHQFFKEKLLPREFKTIVGKKTAHEIQIIKSTTKLTKLEMGEYMDKISAMTEVAIPDPKDAGYL